MIYIKEDNLEKANFIGANLDKANFVGANLYKANLERADLIDAKGSSQNNLIIYLFLGLNV